MEVDHTPVDLLVVDENRVVIGRPTFTVIFDRYSRRVPGYCLSLAGYGVAAVFSALRHAMLPKTYLSTQYAKHQLDWPCFGWMERLLLDNGTEFHTALAVPGRDGQPLRLGRVRRLSGPERQALRGALPAHFQLLCSSTRCRVPRFRTSTSASAFKPRRRLASRSRSSTRWCTSGSATCTTARRHRGLGQARAHRCLACQRCRASASS
ncbi:MAG: hypothetical protein MZW92_07680 [Comamonadaceae bacterium]|nr:hypothetical protein [Comamonadaceae bacterium]